ncbi:MAG: hypothetical protein KAX31_07805, partial [Thermoplasmata archaeon]|nr:hypothetical protein [Thermoplasmata archaeon]
YLITDITEPEVTFVPPTPADGAIAAIGTQITVRIHAHDFVDICSYGGGATLWWKNSTETVYTKNAPMMWDGWVQGSNHNYFIDDSSIVEIEYAQVTYYGLVWDGNGNVATSPERLIQFGDPWICLDPGWNLISIWLIQENTTIEQVLSPISGKYDSVQYYDAFNSSDHWKTYSVFKPNQLNDLTDINHTIGFWINATEWTGLSFDGEISLSTNITLKAGWNLVGYPRCEITGVDDVFASLPELERIECFDPAAPYRIREMESLEWLSPNCGYWFKVSADCVWTVNWW